MLVGSGKEIILLPRSQNPTNELYLFRKCKNRMFWEYFIDVDEHSVLHVLLLRE